MALPIDAQGWLIPGTHGGIKVIRHPQTPKTMPLAPDLKGKPLGMVWHWTGGGYGSGRDSGPTQWNIQASADPKHAASWNFYINRDGEIHQFAPASLGTWATGGPGTLWAKKGGVPYFRPIANMNWGTVAVELQNAGVLLPKGNDWYGWPYGSNASGMSEIGAREAALAGKINFDSRYKVDASRAVPWPDGNTYDRFTDPQINSAQELARTLAQYAGWQDPEHIHYGHRTFYVKRDPGLLWMDGVLPQIEKNIFGRAAGSVASSPATPLFLLALGMAGFFIWKYRRS